MPLYEITNESFRSIAEASFTELKLRERGDLQRLLRTQIEVLGDDLYVLTEEFADWEDSRCRIDLLAVDKEANLVVIELKRTSDGGHMELQAIRYASMVSAMTFARATEIHKEFLSRFSDKTEEAQQRLMEFLGWDEVDEENFAADVRIILASEDFSKELTTSVLWLRDHDIDISCVRLRPYQDGATRLIDVQQIIPLPEAQDYQVQLRKKEQEGRKRVAARDQERFQFWSGLIAIAKRRKTRHANIRPSMYHWIGASSGIRGLGFNYVVVQKSAEVMLYIDRGNQAENKRIFDQLHAQREAVEKAFGGQLVWERLDDKRACRIKQVIETGGYRTSEVHWPELQEELVDAMIRLEAALKPALDGLKV